MTEAQSVATEHVIWEIRQGSSVYEIAAEVGCSLLHLTLDKVVQLLAIKWTALRGQEVRRAA